MNEENLIDWSVARDTVQDDEELLRELVTTFLEEAPRIMHAMRTALESGDAVSLQRAAHMLKGTLGHFGAQPAYDVAFQLECIAREGDLTTATQALKRVNEAMAQVTPILLDYVREAR